MEFQKRGACHFHLIVDKGIEEDELKRMWFEIVGSGDSRHRNHGAHISPIRNTEGFKKYLAAYLTKEEQKKIPYFYENAGRFWGYTRSLVNVDIRIIVGPKKDIRIMRRNLRIFRRWQKAQRRKWYKKQVSSYNLKKENPYVFVVPGEYLYVRDARKLINYAKKCGYDENMFYDWARAWA